MIKRTIEDKVINLIKNRPVTLITGARQVGKSTLCKMIMDKLKFNYVSLDDLREKELAIKDPELFLTLHPAPLIIDEVQYAPKLFNVIESIVNKVKFNNNSNYGMYLLTGSQIYKLMIGVSESLAGRVSIVDLSPLSMSEINNTKEEPLSFNIEDINKRISTYKIDINTLYSHIVRGFYPELYANKTLDSDKFYSDYIQTYIERDVSQIIKLNEKLKFQRFMEILASLTGEEYIVNNLAKDVGVDNKTIMSWTSVLVSSDIIRLLEPYNENSIVKRVIKRPKVYFNDTGLACYLARLNNPKNLMASVFNGRFIETYIVNEIIKSFKNNLKDANFYYYRDTKQNEIDLVILLEGELHLIECKSGISYNKNDIKSFSKLKGSKYKIGISYIISNTNKIYPIDKDIYCIPISSI